MEFSVEHIYKQIKNRGYTWAKVQINNKTKLVLSTEAGVDKTPDEIIRDLKEFFADFPGTYTILLKKKPADRDTTMIQYDKVNVNDFAYAQPNEPVQSAQTPNELKKLKEQMRKELLAELVEEKKKNDLAKAHQEYKNKIRDLETIGGKLSFLINKVLENNNLTKGVLQGNSDTTTNDMDTAPKNLNLLTEQEKAQANEGLMRLLSVTNPTFLLEMSKKLQAKPDLINTLKNFL